MSDEQGHMLPPEPATPRWVGIVVVVLAAVSLVALGIGWSAQSRSGNLAEALKAQVQASKKAQTVLEQRLQQTEEANAQVQGEVSVITDRLKLTQGELARARYQARKIQERSSKQISQLSQGQQQISSTLATKASADDVNKLSGDVSGVKTDLDSTKQSLQMARDQFGNLIARNHEEISELRKMGERNIFEFTVNRKGRRKKVGDLALELRGTNTKQQLFTLYLYVDDKRFEKKNRSVDEPIYFYTAEYQSPLELVINSVTKHKITGYLSEPKANAASGTTATGTGR